MVVMIVVWLWLLPDPKSLDAKFLFTTVDWLTFTAVHWLILVAALIGRW
jgi:hypothetical protein